MGYVLKNDKLMKRDQVTIDFEDRGYQFGDGVYEAIGVYDGVPFKTTEHLERLARSLDSLEITLPYGLDVLEERLMQLMEKSNLVNGLIYFQVTRGVAKRAHHFPGDNVLPTLIAYTTDLDQPADHVYNEGVQTILIDDIRWTRCDIKSLNLLPNVLAKQKAMEQSRYESIMVKDGAITEASKANVFMVKDNKVYTHPANNLILNGITRLTVIDICNELGIEVVEEPFTEEFLLQADEVFLTSTFVDVIPVSLVDDQPMQVGPIAKDIQAALIKLTRK